MTKKMHNVLRRLEEQSCSEASAIAECLRDIASNGEEAAADQFLLTCANELRGWAQFVIDAMKPQKKGR